MSAVRSTRRLTHSLRNARPAIKVLVIAVVGTVCAIAGRRVIRGQAHQLLNPPTVVEWAAIGALSVVAVGVVVTTKFYRRWMFWRPHESERPWTSAFGAFVAVAMLVEVFTAVTAVLAQLNLVSVKGFDYGHGTAGFGQSPYLLRGDADIYQSLEALYVWNFLDAIPALKVPETLTWRHPGHGFANAAGGC